MKRCLLFVLVGLFLLMGTAVAAPIRVVTSGSLIIGGNIISKPYIFERSGDSLFANNLRLWPRVVPGVQHAPITSTNERRHQLYAQVHDHPDWSIGQKL